MSIKFYNKPDPSLLEEPKYTKIPNDIHDHPTLGIEAKTLLWTLLRYATCPNFIHHDATIRKHLECGKNKLETLFAKAARAGYVFYEKVRGERGRVVATIRHFARYPKWSRNGEGAYACALCVDDTCANCKDATQRRTQNPCATRAASTPIETRGLDIMALDDYGVLLNTDLLLPITDKNNNAHSANARSYLDEEYKKFYDLFPKKKDKARGRKAFENARKTTSMDKIMEGLARWRASDTPIKYWPYPASWLNGKRWEDEMEDVSAPRKPSAEDQYAHLVITPRAHKTEQETKQELEQQMPKTRANPDHVSSLVASVRENLVKQSMETRNVRNNGGRVITTAEQRYRDGGENVIAPGSSEAERMVRGVSTG